MNKRKIVCVIDDDFVYHFAVKKLLQKIEGVEEVLSFYNGIEAIDYLAKYQTNRIPDLIFLDIRMPVLDGWGFLERYEQIEENLEDNPVIYLVSSSSEPDDIKRARYYKSVEGYIIKPISRQVLLDKVK